MKKEKFAILKYKGKALIELRDVFDDRLELGIKEEYFRKILPDLAGWEELMSHFKENIFNEVVSDTVDPDFFEPRGGKIFINWEGVRRELLRMSKVPSEMEEINNKIAFLLYMVDARLAMISRDASKCYDTLIEWTDYAGHHRGGDLGSEIELNIEDFLTERREYEALVWWLSLQTVVLWVRKVLSIISASLYSLIQRKEKYPDWKYQSNEYANACNKNNELKQRLTVCLGEMKGERLGIKAKWSIFVFIWKNRKRTVYGIYTWPAFRWYEIRYEMHWKILERAGVKRDQGRKPGEVLDYLKYIHDGFLNFKFLKAVWRVWGN